MAMMDRRKVLTLLFSGAAAASAGSVLMTGPAQSAPMTVPKIPSPEPESLVEKTVVFVRRRRRRVCWWHRGRRVCRWRRW